MDINTIECGRVDNMGRKREIKESEIQESCVAKCTVNRTLHKTKSRLESLNTEVLEVAIIKSGGISMKVFIYSNL